MNWAFILYYFSSVLHNSSSYTHHLKTHPYFMNKAEHTDGTPSSSHSEAYEPTCICIRFSLLRMKVHPFQSKDKYTMDPFLCKNVSFLLRNYVLSFTLSYPYAISSPESRKSCRPRSPFNKQICSGIFHH